MPWNCNGWPLIAALKISSALLVMRRIYRTIVHIVARAGTILLIGESGTGKAIKGSFDG